MGQGYSMTTLSAASATIDVPELSDLTQDKTLASARFMKSVRARSQQGFVFAKVVMKPYSAFDVREYVKQITDERNMLASVPNALGYQRIVEVGSGGYLVRQYMYSSVYDRLSTRPFLEDIEKRWLSYQLLSAVKDCHAQNLYHGDIKTENLLVTSWNWLYLTDFSSSIKPTTLPEDNPADFSFYFDTSARRVCYIAPERFTSVSTEEAPQELNWAMDMFSVGCAIAEMFLEGPIFSLSQIFKYRSGEYNPEHAHIQKIDDPEVRAMVLNMIDLDPEKRYSAEQHLSFYKSKIFPEYFYSFLHDYMQDLTEPISSGTQLALDSEILAESDRKIERVFYDFDKIAYFLGYSEQVNDIGEEISSLHKTVSGKADVHIDNALHDGTLLFLTLVSSALRNTAKSSARLKACGMLTSFAHRLPDEAKLDRILPYVVGMLGDKSDAVKVAALHATTSILNSVRVVSPVNAYLFPEYIFPRLRSFLNVEKFQPSALTRAAYASCLASLALASGRMLDMVQAIRADGRFPSLSDEILAPDASFHGLYDVARAELIPHFEESTTILITDPETSVRRALLGSISRLCLFFGSSKSSDVILSHLNTYLNEPDWMLRCAFYDALVGVATYVGTSSLEQFIVPIMIGSMTDAEHFVVERVIRSFARMAALGLFQRAILWDLTGLISRYLVHPSSWLREAAAQFVEQACQFLSAADRYCIMLPILQPFLRAPLLDFSEECVLDKLKSPLSRAVFEAAVLWASKRGKSLFWTAASRDGTFIAAQSETSLVTSNFTKRFPNRIPPSQKDKDDQQSLDTLRNFGMVPDDEVKLMALREYILKYSQHKTEVVTDELQRTLGKIVSLAQLDITPQNVFFDAIQPYRPARRRHTSPRPLESGNARTIADALMDASVTIDAATPNRMQSIDDSDKSTRPQAIPAVDAKNRKSSSGEQTPTDFKADSADRPNIRIEGIKGESARRSSSVAGRHALLDTDRLSAERRDSKSLKHHNSSFNLPHRTETIKAGAEISTTQETAFGKLDRSSPDKLGGHDSALTQSLNATEKSRSKSPMSQMSGRAPFEANHSYTGGEPAVIRLLDSHVADNFPIDLLDFGAEKKSSDIETAIKSATTPTHQPNQAIAGIVHGNKEPWRPAGLLVAQFVEHTAAINRVLAAPDHAYFVTASDDGTCKIWDTSRLEKNVSARSRYTHRHATETKVKSLCFIDDTHAFVSGATDGSIHAVRVDVKAAEGNEPTKFSKPILVRDWQIPSQHSGAPRSPHTTKAVDDIREHAVCMHHYREQNSRSILLIATSMCRILMVDMKNMEVIRIMYNPFHHGTPTTFCVDKKHHWMMLGTSHGVLDLWDLRFKLRLRSFGIGGAGIGHRVDKLLLHPSRGHGKWVVASCGGEISIWDIEKLTCREVLRPASFKLPHDSARKPKNYEPWHPDEESSDNMLKRFASQIDVDEALLQPLMNINPTDPIPANSKISTSSQPRPLQTSSQPSPSITSLLIFNDYLSNPTQPAGAPTKSALMLSAGSDRTLRYWNLAHIEQSSIVSGPMLNVVGEENRVKPRYETSWPTSMSLSGLVQLVEEKLSDTGAATAAAGDDTPGAARGSARKRREATLATRDRDAKEKGAGGAGKQGQGQGQASGGVGAKNNTGSSVSTVAKTPRNTIISLAQEQMLKTHMDDITDLCLLRKPYGCIVSVDRGGAVFVFH